MNWTPPPDRPLPPLPQDQPALGNASWLVLVNSSHASFPEVHPTVIAALQHFGVPYRVWDLAKSPLPESEALGCAGLLLAQAHLGRALARDSAIALLRAVRAGVGLFSLDPWLQGYPAELRRSLGLRAGSERRAVAFRVATGNSFVTTFRETGEMIPLRAPVAVLPLEGAGRALLRDDRGHPVLHAGRLGRGRFLWWGVSPEVWKPRVLGHGWGLDDFFWRGLAWCARKPFAMKAMPPMATMRFDDCAGWGGLRWILSSMPRDGRPLPAPLSRILAADGKNGSVLRRFRYVHLLNAFGWRPEVSLFVDQISKEDWREVKLLHDRGGAQFSAHAFADGFDDSRRWWSQFISHRGLRVKTGRGSEVRPCLTSSRPYRFARFSRAELDANFRKLDRIARAHRVRFGRTTNMHWRNPPSNALTFYLDRGQVFSSWTSRYNCAYVDPRGYAWRMLPYGNAGMCLDYMPIPVDAPASVPSDGFFAVMAHVMPPGNFAPSDRRIAGKQDAFGDNVDFCRAVKPVLPGLYTHRDLGQIARTIVRQTRLGLQSLFFACPMTHEMNLATLKEGEWREVLTEVAVGLRRYPHRPTLYDKISVTARAKCETHLARAEVVGKRLRLDLRGQTGAPVPLRVFTDKGERCAERILLSSPVEGSLSLRL